MNQQTEASLSAYPLVAEDVSKLESMLLASRRIVILPHTSPDGDALGSTLGLANFIKALEPTAEVVVISPDPIDKYLHWMLELGEVMIWSEAPDQADQLIAQAQLILCLDHNQLSRLRYSPLIEAVSQASAPLVLIDHHLFPEEGFALRFSYPGLSSTSELVYMLIVAMGHSALISPDCATLLLTGIITDTGRLMYGCFYPEVFEHFSALMALGADYPKIIDALSYHAPLAQLKAEGYLIYHNLEVYPELRTAIIMLSKEEMSRLGICKGDTEGLVNKPLSVEGIDSVCFIREEAEQVKLSMRSVGDLPINLVAQRGFGGGGHTNAAGAEYKLGGMELAKNTYLRELKLLLEECL